ncbi:MAG: 1,2-phenylacetyl-CoA epoxidase subunit PaaD, partial [Bacteroidia bacterium]
TSLSETAAVWNILRRVPDPEIPVLNVVEMGIIRSINVNGTAAEVGITPTYSGCPAMDVIGDEIKRSLLQNGFSTVTIKQVLSPAWTTDWLTDEAREKLRQYGIAPPEHSTAEKAALHGAGKTVNCPRCRSSQTHMISNFGSTACKALWQCDECKEPFDYFKCI